MKRFEIRRVLGGGKRLESSPQWGEEAIVHERLASVTSAGEGNLAAKQLRSEAAKRNLDAKRQRSKDAKSFTGIISEKVYSQLTTHLSLKKAAFTLAEVLITLGIIGVVAAITLPTLIQNYQKQVYVTQLKKVVNTFENNSRKILADEGVDSLFDTPLYSVDGSISDGAHDYKLNKDYFEKHYKLTPLSETTEWAKMMKSIKSEISSDELYNYYSNDGACITGTSNASRFFGLELIVDTNCDKRPNKAGYDRFYIPTLENGLITTLRNDGLEAAYCTSEFLDALEENAAMQLVVGGGACFKRIVQDGWKINY